MNQNIIETIVFLVTFIALVTGFIFLFSSKTSNLPMVKTFKESTTIRVTTSVVSILLAWISPFVSLKVLLFIVSFILLISIFPFKIKKASSIIAIIVILFVILSISALLLAPFLFMTNLSIINSNTKSTDGTDGIEINLPGIHIKVPQNYLFEEKTSTKNNDIEINMPALHIKVPQESFFDNNISKDKILPDSTVNIESISTINIKIPSQDVELELVENDNTLAYPSHLIQKTEKDIMHLQATFSGNNTYVIQIGTQTLKKLNIDCNSLTIIGNGSLKNLNINSTKTKINANIQIENNININSTGFDLNGKLKGKNLNLNTTGSNIKGELDFDKIILDATGVNIDIKSKFNNFNINATSLNGTLEILNALDETGKFYIDTTGGSLKIINKNNAPIDIKNSGIINLIRE
ncbi:hypothetical protein SAMN02745195_00390 [Thermoanaerobacter uzonensis DSM 18761]|uniref:Adhesin n=1 Tax=Thermoanaerobacter uzonensis DSM 18761 TaxID=1123369 RepID=A0A1M4TKC3_9THEO|nr:hypothetical protein [Thermoanaerobacter uzonensis]SHE44814.1 hypothetical protein SAMN02745195_00390 [Thermoanaerobacter uzonensis DSM 18761]